jgi:protein-S-isoprenylcysteine O-methyltransferase Ste14
METSKKKMKFVGESPIIFKVTFLASIPIVIINYCWKDIFTIRAIPSLAMVVSAFILLSIGILLYLYTLNIIKKGFKEEKLLTQGIYSVCRNPLFAIVIFIILPAILLFFKSWLLLIIPVLFYVIFQIFIGKEEELLEKKFGNEYIKYKTNTSRIIPIFWKFRR